MTNRKVILILGGTILILSFMGLILYQVHEQKQAAVEQLRILKEKEEARAKQEEEKRRGEQERQKAEIQRQKAEIAGKQRIEQQRKFEEEELARFQAEQDKSTRETKRIAEIEQAKQKEKQRQENIERAKPLQQSIEYLMSEIAYLEKHIKEIYAVRAEDDRRFKQDIDTERATKAWWSYLEEDIRRRTLSQNNQRADQLSYLKGEEQKLSEMKAKLQNMNAEYQRLTQ